MTVQPLNYTPTAVTDSSGTCTFTFQQTPVTQTWTATVNIPGAPDTAITTAYTNGNPTASWQGSNTYGPLQLGNGQQLTLTCTGMAPFTNYQATAIGHVFTVEQPPITWPTAYADSVTTGSQQIFLESGNFPFNGDGAFGNFIITPASNLYRSFTVYQWVTDAVGTISGQNLTLVLGNQSGYNPYPTNLPYLGPVQFEGFYPALRFPLINGTDTDYTIQIGISLAFPASGTLNYVIVGDLQNTDVAVYNADGGTLNVAGTVTVVPSGQQHVILDSPLPLPVTNTNSTELYVRNLATDQLYVRNQSTDQLYVRNQSTDQLYVRNQITDALYLNTIAGAITTPVAVNTRFGGLPVSNSMYQFGGQSYVNPMVSQLIGGVTKASVSVTTTAATTLVAAPAAGTYIRIQSLIVRGGTAGTTIRVYCATSNYDIWNAAINSAVNLNGQATSNGDGAITVAASGVTTACVITITYDILDQYTNA